MKRCFFLTLLSAAYGFLPGPSIPVWSGQPFARVVSPRRSKNDDDSTVTALLVGLKFAEQVSDASQRLDERYETAREKMEERYESSIAKLVDSVNKLGTDLKSDVAKLDERMSKLDERMSRDTSKLDESMQVRIGRVEDKVNKIEQSVGNLRLYLVALAVVIAASNPEGLSFILGIFKNFGRG
jgi:hypothetical protein